MGKSFFKLSIVAISLSTLLVRCSCDNFEEKYAKTYYSFPVYVGNDSIAYLEERYEWTTNSEGRSFPVGGGGEDVTGKSNKIIIMNSSGTDIGTILSSDQNEGILDLGYNKAKKELFVLRNTTVTVMNLSGNVLKVISDTSAKTTSAHFGPFAPSGLFYTIHGHFGSTSYYSVKDTTGQALYTNDFDYLYDWSDSGFIVGPKSIRGNGGRVFRDSNVTIGINNYRYYLTDYPSVEWYVNSKDTARILYYKILFNDTVYVSDLSTPFTRKPIGNGGIFDVGNPSTHRSSFSTIFDKSILDEDDVGIKIYNFDAKSWTTLRMNAETKL